MVEEMMLLANVTVAEHTLASFASCALLRRHAVPPPWHFEPLLRAAAAAGFSINIDTSKVGQEYRWQELWVSSGLHAQHFGLAWRRIYLCQG